MLVIFVTILAPLGSVNATLYSSMMQSRVFLTLNIPSLARQRCLPSWGSSEDPMVFFFFFFVISQLFDAVDYSNYVYWVSETIIQ